MEWTSGLLGHVAAKEWLSIPTSDYDQRKLVVLFFGFVFWESGGSLAENSRLLIYGNGWVGVKFKTGITCGKFLNKSINTFFPKEIRLDILFG